MKKKPYWVLGAIFVVSITAVATGHFSDKGLAVLTAVVGAVLSLTAYVLDGGGDGK